MASEDSIFGPLTHKGKRLDVASVHRVRKRTKQLRAQLELQRALEGQLLEMKELRQLVKQLARLLAPQRDADVMSAALQQLSTQTGSAKVKQLLLSLDEKLQPNALSGSDMKTIHKLVGKIEAAAPSLLHSNHNSEAVHQLLETRLAALCASGAELLDSHDWETLHDWRKLVKKLMYQFQLQASLTPREERLFQQLEKLGDCLGRIHDMCMLETYVQGHQAQAGDQHKASSYKKIFKLIEANQEQELASFRQLFEALEQLQ